MIANVSKKLWYVLADGTVSDSIDSVAIGKDSTPEQKKLLGVVEAHDTKDALRAAKSLGMI